MARSARSTSARPEFPSPTKPSLVCLHLSPMSSRVYEHFIDAHAAQGGHALAIDTPGFGLSDRPPSPPDIADYARSLVATLDALGLSGRVDLMGYHTGSMIAAETAIAVPNRVRRLVLVAAPQFTAEELTALQDEFAPVEPRVDGGHLTYRWRRFAQHYLGNGLPLEDAAELFTEGFLGGRFEWWGHRAAFAYPPGMRLDEIAQPILVLNPADDLRNATNRAEGRLRKGRIVDLDDWGHGFLDVHTTAAVRLVRSFLDAPSDAPLANLAMPE
ncbi:alpha/beta fold hydrolase [Novosphingobium sp. Gsoil 351]|uniref:alpha/beta fold hydrolase n=1 Tax=Novosphingobium sp. Gsoil 351 TaxID=2675225 RepID=UPI0012B477EB|nr:alpha/beta fold hydrolase [Novosphingobium sp. Gsoil 351]QGN54456.1 alpha/beta fold hydrolase [Novosphingobium sp. Gsoil 351]